MPTTRKRAADEGAAVLHGNSPPTRKKRTRRPAQSSTHSMSTRGETRRRKELLNFMSFAPEIRNLCYSHMYRREETIDLTALRLPTSLRVPGIFTEALPIFFEGTSITILVRSNWCVRRVHLVAPPHSFFASTGRFDLPDLLARIPESAVRFRDVTFQITCCCCITGKTIAEFGIAAMGQDVKCKKDVTCKPILEDDKPLLIAGLAKMLDAAEELVNTEIKSCEGFNGFSVADLQRLAMCFRDTSEEETSEV